MNRSIDDEPISFSEEYMAKSRRWHADVDRVTNQVKVERFQQDKKWGEQNHDPVWWMNILGEEFGESQKALLEASFAGKSWEKYRKELIQTAAVAVAAIQSFDRNGPPEPPKNKSKASAI